LGAKQRKGNVTFPSFTPTMGVLNEKRCKKGKSKKNTNPLIIIQ